MQAQGTQNTPETKPFSAYVTAVFGALLVPVFAGLALLAVPYIFILGWSRQHREHRFRMRMKARGKLMPWAEFLHTMRDVGGTCIEERFSPKGPVRFWWTRENVHEESPYPIIDWFTMRKGRQAEPFIHWCRERYTGEESSNAILVDTGLVSRRDIYALWSECRSNVAKARWVEVAPPEIVPHSSADSRSLTPEP